MATPEMPEKATLNDKLQQRRATGTDESRRRRDNPVTCQGHGVVCVQGSSDTERRRSAFAITLTDDSDMAAAATMGDSRMPRTG